MVQVIQCLQGLWRNNCANIRRSLRTDSWCMPKIVQEYLFGTCILWAMSLMRSFYLRCRLRKNIHWNPHKNGAVVDVVPFPKEAFSGSTRKPSYPSSPFLSQACLLKLTRIQQTYQQIYIYIYIYMSCRQNSMAARWNMILSCGLKAPFGFPCFAHVCLASWLGLWRVFLNGLRDFGCRAPFWRPCAFACVPVRLYSIQSVFVPPLQHGHTSRWEGLHVSTSGWTVFLILGLMRDCIFFPGKAHVANSRSAASSLVRLDRF